MLVSERGQPACTRQPVPAIHPTHLGQTERPMMPSPRRPQLCFANQDLSILHPWTVLRLSTVHGCLLGQQTDSAQTAAGIQSSPSLPRLKTRSGPAAAGGGAPQPAGSQPLHQQQPAVLCPAAQAAAAATASTDPPGGDSGKLPRPHTERAGLPALPEPAAGQRSLVGWFWAVGLLESLMPRHLRRCPPPALLLLQGNIVLSQGRFGNLLNISADMRTCV